MRIRLAVLVALASPLLATVAQSTTTRWFRVTSYADFEAGEAKGVLISSLGELTTGYSTHRIDIPVAFVRVAAVAPDGTVYLGTGDQGELWAYEHGKVKKLAKLPDAVEVTALEIGGDGTVYAGSTPGGRIFAWKGGALRELCKLEADHVWALAWDAPKKTLYAGTGAAGKLYAIDVASGKSRLFWDSGQKHLRSLIRDDDGALWVGTGDEAILYRVTPDGRARAIHDFDGEEIRALARRGGALYLAVNQFEKAAGGATTPTSGTRISLPTGATAGHGAAAGAAGQRKGKGAVYRLEDDGRVEQLHALADGYFTALEVQPDGAVLATSGSAGKAFLLKPDRTVVTAFDFPERQVLAIATSKGAHLLGTGDAGALYEVEASKAKDAVYTSKVLDAEFPARFGNLRWHGSGEVQFETRSGNTAKPDKTWSTWQKPARSDRLADGGVARPQSPDGRYVQFRVTMAGPATVRDAQLYYLVQNQRPRVTEIQTSEEGHPTGSTPTASPSPSGRTRSPIVKIRWKVENPDNDDLVYRLSFREEGEINWKPLGGTDREPLTRAEYDWNTEAVPDGNYVVRVVASDERSNPKELAMEHALTSQPFLVDNRKPEVVDLQVQFPYASGRARDSFSPIQELAFSIDGGEWQMLAPKDGVLDDLVEAFSIRLPQNLPQGTHTLAVRAADAAENLGAAQVTFRVR
jgi:outer membrane protein assembly factor BamB